MTLIGTLVLLCTSLFGSEQPTLESAPAVQAKDGFEQYPGDVLIDTVEILKAEAYRTLIRKLGTAFLQPPSEEEIRELRTKFIAPWLFFTTRPEIGTKSHWEEKGLIIDKLIVEAINGSLATSFYFDSLPGKNDSPMYLEIAFQTEEVRIDQRDIKKPCFSGQIRVVLKLKKNHEEATTLAQYSIACPGRFLLPSHGKKVVWGKSYLNYLVDHFFIF